MAWAIDDYGPIETLALRDIALADPAAGEVIVDVEAMALNPLDAKIMTGAMQDFMPASMPFTPGSDLIGTVHAAGSGAPAAPGDRVLISTWNGALARRALIPASAHVVRCSANTPAAELAALPMAGLTARHIMRMLGDVDGRTLAIQGATGGVGLMLVQMASAAGARVIASGAGADDMRLLGLNGAGQTLDYHDQPFASAVRAGHPAGVDLFVDLVSMFDALFESAAAVRDGGRLFSTLFGPDPDAFGDRISIDYVRLHAEPGDLAAVLDAYLAGQLRANVRRSFAFDEAPRAYQALRDDHVAGKIVVTM